MPNIVNLFFSRDASISYVNASKNMQDLINKESYYSLNSFLPY